MSDKSFEQQVREELSDLRMKPNAAVWETVAASLKKERKRRWVLWMFFLLAGLSGITLWWLTQEQLQVSELSNKNVIRQNPDSFLKTKTLPREDNITIAIDSKKDQSLKADIEKPSTNTSSSNNTLFSPATTKPASIYKTSIDKVELISKGISNAEVVTDVQDHVSKKENKTQVSVDERKTEVVEKEVEKITQQNEKKEKADTSSFVQMQDLKKDTVEIIKETALPKPVLSDSTQLKNSKTVKSNKWKWRIGFNAGTSGVRNSIRSLLEKTNSRAYENAYAGNSAPITGVPGTGAGAFNMKPVVRDAFAFGAFVEVMKKMGKKEQHALGLTAGYHLYSTRTGVGSLNTGTVQFSNVNTTNDANKYYGVKDSASYTSYYHFIQLGLRYYQSLKWFKKVDMQWYAGIGVNALLGSNGLHLGTMNTNTYLFQNRSLLRSMQMDLSGGVDFGLGKAKQVYIGPQVQYMLSNLSKQPGVNQHLFRPSVRLSFLLDKGKKP